MVGRLTLRPMQTINTKIDLAHRILLLQIQIDSFLHSQFISSQRPLRESTLIWHGARSRNKCDAECVSVIGMSVWLLDEDLLEM